MYIAVQAFLLNAAAATAAITALAAKVIKLSGFIARLRELTLVQTDPITAKVVVRKESLKDTVDLAVEVAGAVLSYSNDAHLVELHAKVDITRRSFERLRLAERTALAQNIHNAAATVIAELAPYGVTPALLTEFQETIAGTDEVMNEPRRAMGNRKVATAEIADLHRQIDTLLAEDIDTLMLPLRRSNPALWARYQEARAVFDLPGVRRREQPEAAADAAVSGPAGPVPAANPLTTS